MRLIVFSCADVLRNEAKQINSLFDAGMQRFHFRKPTVELKDWRSIIAEINPEYRNKIVIHNHFELMEEFELYGKHLKSTKEGAYQEFTSAACHSCEELDLKKEVQDYVFLSPVFNSISKSGYTSSFDFTTLQSCLNQFSSKQVIALGGITIDNLQEVKSLGFDGAAVLGTIWNSSNPEKQFKQMHEIIKE